MSGLQGDLMEIKEIFHHLDEYVKNKETEKAVKFLLEQLNDGDLSLAAEVSVNNELIGLYRDGGWVEECIAQCKKQITWMEEMQSLDAASAATIMLNIANALRACGSLEDSYHLFKKAEEIYAYTIDAQDYRMAGLYNNLCITLMEMDRLDEAYDYALKALEIISKMPEAALEIAVTHQNISNIYMKQGKPKQAREESEKAYKILLESGAAESYHAGMVLTSIAQANFEVGLFDTALAYFEKAAQVIYKNVGESPLYAQAVQNLEIASEKVRIKG